MIASSVVGFAIDDVEVAAARRFVHREPRHGERLGVAADGGERRHQLVRHVGEQLTARRVRGIQRGGACFELAGHVVEGVREGTDLVAAAVVGAHVGAPFADSARGFFERLQALARRAEDQERDHHRAGGQQAEAGPGQRWTELAQQHLDRRRSVRSGDQAHLRGGDDDGREVHRTAGTAAAAAPPAHEVGWRAVAFR